ncbi:uncharacterized protein BDZ83DRAFT_657401 [Colletotrichum acutatum]|uniref:Uncharacterized protein n=1 Tax=Glomerella acutata TaxID=27357 RepID=A0AAD8UBC9_GLOAC|nr:uncharacterized protein BDZ83DRAFT_657401 [Colletotrichum acutatum]KAK1708925.1 hypothetical protein BDZ83DRAFT_657401 [Colletotrichum acutatum]
MVTKVANESVRLSDWSEALQYGGNYLDEVTTMEPPGLLEIIRKHREAGAAIELSPYVELCAKLTTSTGNEFWCTSSAQLMSRQKCDSLLLGTLVMGLLKKGLPITAEQPAEQYLGSLSLLRAALSDLQLFHSHKIRLLKQARKTGVDRILVFMKPTEAQGPQTKALKTNRMVLVSNKNTT